LKKYRLNLIAYAIGRIAFYAVLLSYWPLVYVAFDQDIVFLKLYVTTMGFGSLGAVPFGLYFYIDTLIEDIERLLK
jgi:hypothetical protein